MRVQLLRACALLLAVTGAAVAADKPKGKKEKPTPTPPVVEEFSKPTEWPNYGPAHPLDKYKAADTKFTVSKPVGTWVREADHNNAKARLVLTVTDDLLTLKIDMKSGNQTSTFRLDADYSINKESCLFGVIDSCDATSSHSNDFSELAKLSGQPFSVRFRAEGDGLSLKDFKGFGTGLGEPSSRSMAQVLAAVCGRYTQVDPSKPLPPLKSSENNTYSSDPLIRQNELLNQHDGPAPTTPSHLTPQRIHGGILKADPSKSSPRLPDEHSQSEDLRVIGEAWRRHWYNDQPSHMTPQRIHGGILKAETPTATPPIAFAGPVHSAAAELCANRPPSAELMQAKAEEPAPLKLQPVPPPQCDPPTDAEVMAEFNARRAKEVGKSWKLSHDGDDITIKKILVKDKLDDPRAYPVMGMAQLHRCRWECGVYYTNTTGGGGKPKVEVISLDTDCLRVVPAKDAVVPKRMPEK